jgi:NAD(P)-dependent dehydrogenase (short-subunit alcohol dehydrogenase family)
MARRSERKEQMRLEGRKALVTGASRGIGRGIAIGLAREGCDVVVNYVKNREAAEETGGAIEKAGCRAYLVKADVSKVSEVKMLVGESENHLGRIDVLVNNAAISIIEPWSEVGEASWDLTMHTNLRGAFFCAQCTARGMTQRGIHGSIVNLSSTNGTVAESDVLTYNVSKGGMEMLTKSLALELAPHGIRVNALAPGIIETDASTPFLADQAFRRHYREHIPLKRFGRVEECIGAAVFLACDESSYITGQSIIIDGGLISDQCPPL